MLYYNYAPTRRRVPYDPFGALFSGFNAGEPGPRYNVEQLDDDHFRIAVAVPGFAEADLDVTQREDEILVTGTTPDDDATDNVTYLHHGIGGRPFERRFSLADGVRATGANLENGLLRIDLVREVPDEQKPRTIAIAPPSKGGKRKAA